MKKLIFRYLFENYYWHKNKLWSSPEERATVHSISDDLITVFGLTKKQTKWYIKSWCKRNPRFNFNDAWDKVIRLNLKSVQVIGGTRTLDVSWTPELAQDLDMYHGIDAEAELIAILEQELAREMLNELTNGYLNQMNEEAHPQVP